MSDEILLYLILLLMLVLAVGALVPSLLRVGREETSVEREDKAYGSAVTEALRRQRAQLDEDLKSGAVSAEQYEILADDLRRRSRNTTRSSTIPTTAQAAVRAASRAPS